MASTTKPRWTRRPPGANWGDFGPDDQLGRLNLLTAERVRTAAREIVTGERFCLSLPLDYPGGNKLQPRRHPPEIRAAQGGGKHQYNRPLGAEHPGCTDVGCDDCVLLYTQYSTQWDSFAHVGSMFDADGDGVPEPVYYNGFRGHEHVIGHPLAVGDGSPQIVRASALGIETFAAAAIQGRGVMVNLRHHYGDGRRLVGYDDLMRVLEADRVAIEEGDLLCLHTGFAEVVLSMNRDPDPKILHGACAVLDGGDRRLQDWITRSGIAALIADNYAVENRPPGGPEGVCGAFMPLHELCLFKIGVPLGELWHLTPLASALRSAGRYRFFLTAPPLRLPGAVGSPVTPVATI